MEEKKDEKMKKKEEEFNQKAKYNVATEKEVVRSALVKSGYK